MSQRRRPNSTLPPQPLRSIADDVAAEGERLAKAEVVIGHRFRDRTHLLAALTHSSWTNEHPTETPDNEVLELLGDAVLSVIVVDALVQHSPGAGEGELTERRAAHVSADTLARAASAVGLDALLRTERGLEAQRPLNVVADVVEAVLGAVWRDAGDDGLTACRAVVWRLLGPPPDVVQEGRQNPKRLLQERLQRLVGRAPEYAVERGEGPNHAPTFIATARYDGTVLGSGTGGNKRLATEAAAANACTALDDVDDATLKARLRPVRP